MRYRSIPAAAAMAVALLGVTACGGQQGGGEHLTPQQLATQADYNAQPRENVKDGGTLTTDISELSPQFNTWHGDGTGDTQLLWQWYNPQLSLWDANGEWKANPAYLTGFTDEVKGGKSVYTYTINPKATFNDGTPIDWRAFEATWKANSGTNPAFTPSSTDGYSEIESVTRGADDKQAVVTMKKPFAWPHLLYPSLLHPKAANPDTFNKAYVNNPHPEWGAGPYTVDTFDKNAGTISFKRNPKWWGAPGKLDHRVFRALQPSASINAFKNGEIDATTVGTPDRLAQVKTMQGVDIRRSVMPSLMLLTLNVDSPLMKDTAVREAIVDATDRATLAKVRFNGLDYTEPLPGSFSLYSFQDGYRDNVAQAGITFDKAKAIQLLDQAGWTPGPDGIRAKGGQKFSLRLPAFADSPTYLAGLRALQAMLKEIGVDVRIEMKLGPTDFSTVIQEKSFDLMLSAVASTDPYPAYFCQMWCKGSELNKAGFGSKEFDAKIAQATAIADPKAQIARLNDLEVEALQQYTNLPLTNGPQIVATKVGLANVGAKKFATLPVEDIGWQK